MSSLIFTAETMSFADISLGFEQFQGYLNMLSRLEDEKISECDGDSCSFPEEIIEVVGEESFNLGEKLKNMIKSLIEFLKKAVSFIREKIKKFAEGFKNRKFFMSKIEKRQKRIDEARKKGEAEGQRIINGLSTELYSNLKFKHIPSKPKYVAYVKNISQATHILVDNGKLVSFFDKYARELFDDAVLKGHKPIPEFDLTKLINVSAVNHTLELTGYSVEVSEHSLKLKGSGEDQVLLNEASFKDAGWPNVLDDAIGCFRDVGEYKPHDLNGALRIGDDMARMLMDLSGKLTRDSSLDERIANKIVSTSSAVSNILLSIHAIEHTLYLQNDKIFKVLYSNTERIVAALGKELKIKPE